jgi:hypothetical protein
MTAHCDARYGLEPYFATKSKLTLKLPVALPHYVKILNFFPLFAIFLPELTITASVISSIN